MGGASPNIVGFATMSRMCNTVRTRLRLRTRSADARALAQSPTRPGSPGSRVRILRASRGSEFAEAGP